MMKKTLFLLAVCLFTACTGSEKIIVTNIHDLTVLPPQSYIFTLPRTRIEISIWAVRHHSVPGPYNAYAEKLLGIQGAPSLSETNWEICSVGIRPLTEPDPEYFFSLQSRDNSYVPEELLDLTSSGLVLKPDVYNPLIRFSEPYNDIPEPIHFTDLSVKRSYEENTSDEDEKKSGITIPVDVPVIKKNAKFKSTEEKAVEAANFIIKIRKRRFKLLAGQYDVFPEGKALEISVKELTALEEEYLSLFIGKTYSDTVLRTFYYIPQSGRDSEQNVICRFSNETGFFDAVSAGGRPLILEIKNQGFTEGLKQLELTCTGPGYENMILYRIPDNATLKIYYGNTILLEAELKVFQYGTFLPYYLKNK
jgi:hypothetical protein